MTAHCSLHAHQEPSSACACGSLSAVYACDACACMASGLLATFDVAAFGYIAARLRRSLHVPAGVLVRMRVVSMGVVLPAFDGVRVKSIHSIAKRCSVPASTRERSSRQKRGWPPHR